MSLPDVALDVDDGVGTNGSLNEWGNNDGTTAKVDRTVEAARVVAISVLLGHSQLLIPKGQTTVSQSNYNHGPPEPGLRHDQEEAGFPGTPLVSHALS